MKVLALISGGKDSIYNLCRCIDQGHQIVALGNLYNCCKPVLITEEGHEGYETDSYMYQTVGTNATLAIAQALQKPIYRRPIKGKPKKMTLEYDTAEEGDQVEDLDLLVMDVLVHFIDMKAQHPDINAVSSGAIFSTYQKLRVQNICKRHGLTSLAYLWHRQQKQLLKQMIQYGMEAILIKVACYGLNKNHLGRTIAELNPYFLKLNKQCDMNVCGEGGQYESLVLNCPHFKKKLRIINKELIQIDANEISPVAFLLIKQIIVEYK